MKDEQPRREGDAGSPSTPASEIRVLAPLAEDDATGGDPVCWAHLVCDECGAVTAEGHRAGCSRQDAG